MNKMIGKIFPLVIVCLVIITVNFPYVFAVNQAQTNYVFGGFLFNTMDGNSYLAKLYQGWSGEWNFTLPFTSESGQGSHLFLFYIFLGHLARELGINLLLMFHLARALGTVVMLIALYNFIKVVLPNNNTSIVVFAFTSFGSGLGWIALIFGGFTSDFWVAEMYPFLSAFANPHFQFGLAIMLWMLTQRGCYQSDRVIVFAVKYFIAALILSITSPFHIVIVFVIYTALIFWDMWDSFYKGINYGLFSRSINFRKLFRTNLKKYPKLIWIMLGGFPYIIYIIWLLRNDALIYQWHIQNLTPSMPLWDIFIALSPAIILAFAGVKKYFNFNKDYGKLMIVWGAVCLGFAFIPVGLQRRFLAGIYIPITVLAVIGIVVIKDLLSRRLRIYKPFLLLTIMIFIMIIPTNIILLISSVQAVSVHSELFLHVEEINAFNWIEENTKSDALILGAPISGLFIPGYTGRRVVYGHPFETVNAEEKKSWVLDYFRCEGDFETLDEGQSLLKNNNIDYVFYGPREKELSNCFPEYGLKDIAYENSTVTIYKIEHR